MSYAEDISAMPVIMTIAEIGAFLLEHGDTIVAVKEALGAGATKPQLMKAIRGSMVLASDAAIEAELGPRPK